jgi:excisionase family DNA binding protein
MAAALSTGQAAARMGVSVSTIQRWDREGILRPAFRTALNQRRYTVEQIDAAKKKSIHKGEES